MADRFFVTRGTGWPMEPGAKEYQGTEIDYSRAMMHAARVAASEEETAIVWFGERSKGFMAVYECHPVSPGRAQCGCATSDEAGNEVHPGQFFQLRREFQKRRGY